MCTFVSRKLSPSSAYLQVCVVSCSYLFIGSPIKGCMLLKAICGIPKALVSFCVFTALIGETKHAFYILHSKT